MSPKNTENESDIIVINHGSIFTFNPVTKEAEDHLAENVSEEATWYAGGLVVEARYARDLADALQGEGFSLA